MIRSTLLFALALACTTPQIGAAREVEVAYKGVVTRSSGPHAASFVPGQEISIRYTVETATPDSQPDPSSGVFHNGLRRLEVTIAAAGVTAVTGAGTVQTFNDVGSDQVFFYGPAVQGQLAGQPITRAEVDFIDYTSRMIASDEIPAQALVTTDSFAMLYTNAGYTFVNFLAEEVKPPVASCSSEGFTGIKLTVCKQICEVPQSSIRLSALIKAYIAAYREDPPCVR